MSGRFLPRCFSRRCLLLFHLTPFARFTFTLTLLAAPGGYESLYHLVHFRHRPIISTRHLSYNRALPLDDSVCWLSGEQFIDQHLLIALLPGKVLNCQLQLIKGMGEIDKIVEVEGEIELRLLLALEGVTGFCGRSVTEFLAK